MNKSKLTLKDFQLEIISKKQQKTITGGDMPPTDPVDPGKVGGGGNT
ncbi:rSAM-modified peptide [Flavobacterium ustbae]|nr:rSAM-modified peptide [Flavobacterium ustbae]